MQITYNKGVLPSSCNPHVRGRFKYMIRKWTNARAKEYPLVCTSEAVDLIHGIRDLDASKTIYTSEADSEHSDQGSF